MIFDGIYFTIFTQVRIFSIYLKSFSLFCGLFKSLLFDLQILGGYSRCLSVIDFKFNSLGSENILQIILVLLGLLKLVLWSRIGSVLSKVPCAPEEIHMLGCWP